MATFTNDSWDGSASRWKDAQSYCASCLIKRDHSSELTKDDCSLPIKEPGGDINVNGLRVAQGVLLGSMGGLKGVSAEDKRKAARTIINYMRQAKVDPAQGLYDVAGMAPPAKKKE